MGDSATAVFLSYASEDEVAAQHVCAALRAAGLDVWFDKSELRGGDAWDHKIRQQIHDCRLFVPLISAHTEARVEGYFRREWRLAVQRSDDMAEDAPFILPVVLDDTAEARARVPDRFRDVQWTRLPHGEDASGFAMHVVRLLNEATMSPAEQRAPADAGARQHLHVPPRGRWRATSAAAAIVLLAAAAIVGLHYWNVTRGPGAREMVSAGAAGTTRPAVAPAEKSIAVLPFVDLSPAHDQEYFADGMAEEILDLLAKLPGLVVTGRTSSFQFKGKNVDLRTVGRELGVAHVLEGSVRKSGDQVRVTVQLISTGSGTHEWSESYDRHIDDVLKLQETIAAAVVRELQLTLAPGVLDPRAGIKDAGVYDLILRGRQAQDQFSDEGFSRAVTLFQEALDRDPTAAAAAAELCVARTDQVSVLSLPPATGMEQARRAATDALRLDPKNVEAHLCMASIHITYDWDWAGAERELEAAAKLAPGDVEVLAVRATLSDALGRSDEALIQMKSVVARDPLNAESLQLLSNMHEALGNLPEAEAAMRRALDIRPGYSYGHFNLGLLALQRGDPEAALHEMQQETVEDGRQEGLALVYYALGRKAESDAALAALIAKQANRSALDIAQVYAFRGQPDEAMQWLERAYAQKDPWLFEVRTGWLMKNLANDPRFTAFLQKMNRSASR